MGGYREKSNHRQCQLLAHRLINSPVPACYRYTHTPAPANTAPASAPATSPSPTITRALLHPRAAQPEHGAGAAASPPPPRTPTTSSHTHKILAARGKTLRQPLRAAPPYSHPSWSPGGSAHPHTHPPPRPGTAWRTDCSFQHFSRPKFPALPLPRCQRLFFS